MKGGPSKTKKKKKRYNTLYESENTSTLHCQKLSFCICPVHVFRFPQASVTDICQEEGKEIITSSWMGRFFWKYLGGGSSKCQVITDVNMLSYPSGGPHQRIHQASVRHKNLLYSVVLMHYGYSATDTAEQAK